MFGGKIYVLVCIILWLGWAFVVENSRNSPQFGLRLNIYLISWKIHSMQCSIEFAKKWCRSEDEPGIYNIAWKTSFMRWWTLTALMSLRHVAHTQAYDQIWTDAHVWETFSVRLTSGVWLTVHLSTRYTRYSITHYAESKPHSCSCFTPDLEILCITAVHGKITLDWLEIIIQFAVFWGFS